MSVSPKTKRERSKNTYLQRSLLLDWVGAFGAEDIGIDLGTSNAVIYVKNKGLVFPEAAVVAKNEILKRYSLMVFAREKWKAVFLRGSSLYARLKPAQSLIITVQHI